MLPIVKSGFSGTPTDINTWTNITQQVLGIGEYALTSTETMSYTFNDIEGVKRLPPSSWKARNGCRRVELFFMPLSSPSP